MTTWSPRILVIGAGAGGIAAAVRLRQDGFTDLLIVDRADGVGGVWQANVYPGAQCDVPSHLYSLSFHPRPDWSRRFADQEEILDYLEEVAEAHGLHQHLRLRTEVTDCAWDDEAHHWTVGLRNGDGTRSDIEVDLVIAATGQLSAPAYPAIPGLDRFTGPVFHSARWQHDVELAGRRVGVIGTGASATQFVPVLARTAAHLDLFQRTAPYIIGKPNRRYSAREAGFYARAPGLQRLSRLRQYLWHELLGLPFTTAPSLMRLPTRAWRRRLERVVDDPGLRAKLTPDYTMGCKRLLRAPGWYRTMTRPNVSLITDPIVAVMADGVRTASGDEHPLDVLILGTGFEATRFLGPMRVTGRGGQCLADRWRDGARAYLGIMVPDFPNFFLVYGPGTNLGHTSVLVMIESQIAWIRSALRTMRRREWRRIEVRPEIQSRYDTWFTRASAGTVWETGCASWYTRDGRNLNNWPGSTIRYRFHTRRFRASDITSRSNRAAHR
jgi:cation diffusion facilitator CzcD-associated flavoprotein CzcO